MTLQWITVNNRKQNKIGKIFSTKLDHELTKYVYFVLRFGDAITQERMGGCQEKKTKLMLRSVV